MATHPSSARSEAVGRRELRNIAELRRLLIFVAPAYRVPDILAQSLCREFPWLSVMRVDEPDAACRDFAQPVQLVLVDAVLAGRSPDAVGRIAQHHPFAHVAITFDDESALNGAILQLISSNVVRSVVPMNLRIDVWLSALRLILRGGEHYPAAVLRKFAELSRLRPAPREAVPPWLRGTVDGVVFDELTSREREILDLAARGLQNKSVAASLGLSENTVKIHIHNIIRKLGVHNRTEAAARYHEHLDDRVGRANGDGRPAAGG